jgi:phosphomannomutase/phosphoglucomutase
MSLFVKEIRGGVNTEITNEYASNLGEMIGNFLNPKNIVNVGRDDNPVSQMILQSLTAGIMATGRNIGDYGIVPNPVVHYLSNFNQGDIQINIGTNQDKVVIKVYSNYEIHLEPNYPVKHSKLHIGQLEYINKYHHNYHTSLLKNIDTDVIKNKRPKVLLDCGNKSTMPFITEILSSLSVDSILFSSEKSNKFDEKNLRPSSEDISTLSDMVTTVGADLGILLNNEVDQAVFIDENGETVRDQTMIGIFAKNILKETSGIIISSIVASLALEEIVNKSKGQLLKVPVDSVLRESIYNDAIFAADEPGQYIFPKFQSCSDAIYSSIMLIQIICSLNIPLSILAKEIPEYQRTGFSIKCDHENKSRIIELLKGKLNGKINSTDGVRADFGDSYVLIRPSRFEPVLKIYIEAKDSNKLNELSQEVNGIISEYNLET